MLSSRCRSCFSLDNLQANEKKKSISMWVSALSAKHQSACASWEHLHVILCHLSNLGHVALLAFIPGLNYLKMVDSYCLMRAWVLCTLDSGYSQGRRIGCFIKLWSLVAVLSMTQWAGKQWYLTRTAFIHFLLVRTVFPLETTKWAARIKMDHTVGWNSELMTKSDRERWTEVWVLVKSCAPIDPRSTPAHLGCQIGEALQNIPLEWT